LNDNTVTIRGCKRIVGGKGYGELLRSDQPLNFLAMVDPRQGRVTDPGNQLYGTPLVGRILAFPSAIGSSVGAYVFYSFKVYGTAPSAIICNRADITTASGCAIAEIPLVELPEGFSLSSLRLSSMLEVDANERTIIEKV
jgi:uncharacterized protein